MILHIFEFAQNPSGRNLEVTAQRQDATDRWTPRTTHAIGDLSFVPECV